MSPQESLLIELLCEELPPKSLRKLSDAFSNGIFVALKEAGFIAADADFSTAAREFATPRRLGLLIENVADQQGARSVERKGPAVNASFDAQGKAMPALVGFAKSCGVEITSLERQTGPKGEYFVSRSQQAGESLDKHLANIVEMAAKKLPVAKLMRWGDGDVQFVRPVHGLIMLHGARIIPGQVLGLPSGNQTQGHRFLSQGSITIAHADDYETALAAQGSVTASYAARLHTINTQLTAAAQRFGEAILPFGDVTDLRDEVTSLVEHACVYAGSFDVAFLEVPRECLVASMQHHQRYFPLSDAEGKLIPHFLFVSNIETSTPDQIIHGNERVLRARLADAQFFFEQDKRTSLAGRVARLAKVVYHNKLGSQLERVERLEWLAIAIAAKLAEINSVYEIEDVRRAAQLCKADLLTDMVGEFPELQGIMGHYYALHDGESVTVAEAIREHYARVPRSATAICVGLADKLDILVGIYGIGLIPTGEKDPFALRRNALGVLRILVENGLSLNLMQLLEIAEAQFPAGLLAGDVSGRVYEFMLERLKPYLREQGFAPDEIDAVLSLQLTRMDWVVPRLRALQEFRKLPEAASLASANKRIRNILKQAQPQTLDALNETLLTEPSEIILAAELEQLEQDVLPMLQREEYTQALARLASLRPAVDAFFDQVMVMSENPDVRCNRLTLLSKLSGLFMRVADLSRLQG